MEDDITHKKDFKEAIKLLSKGVDGDKKAANSAFEKFSKLREINPDSAMLEAYYGSSVALVARDAVHPLEKADKAQEGLDALNRAVSLDPQRKEIRLLRANVCVRLPESYFHCSKMAIEDFTLLLNLYEKDASYLPQKQVSEILKNLAEAYYNVGKPVEAQVVLQRLAKQNSKNK
ncbi:tetratricopeptide repeat protein [Paenibacillus planticolens]|uniref:Tetratricopeptide repeat protein n=1 Tax=Paenibacillus planticolens TaxID=2654976 RepID=A0ABX1ZI32_9BACL|nr:hypothetical protein [Paenibacillus planticolens]NOU99726.1 hypothetical protein [Paenibacillus planticolens]